METAYLRLRAYPLRPEVADFISRYERVYVVDQNRDAQLLMLFRLELAPDLIGRLTSIRYYGGMPLDARTVTAQIVEKEGL